MDTAPISSPLGFDVISVDTSDLSAAIKPISSPPLAWSYFQTRVFNPLSPKNNMSYKIPAYVHEASPGNSV